MQRKNNAAVLDGSLHSYLGDITAYHRNQRMVIRGKHTTHYTDANNLVQVYNRLRNSNLTAFARAVQGAFGRYWEDQIPGRYYYHNFISANASARPYGLVVNQHHNVGAAVVSNYVVTQGSLPAISVDTFSLSPAQGISNIIVGDLAVTSATTIGEFSRALVNNNGDRFRFGDILAFFCVYQRMEEGKPRVAVGSQAVSLIDSDEFIFDSFDLRGFGTTNRFLSIRGVAPVGGYTWVHARTIPNTTQLLVSPQRLTLSDRTILDVFSNVEHMRSAAIQMGASIPDEISPNFLHHDPKIYEAFGVPCKSAVSGNCGFVDTPTADSPFRQSLVE